MKQAYADSSFVVRLLMRESGVQNVIASHRSLGRPKLIVNGLHHIEVTNAIRLKAYLEIQQNAKDKAGALRRRDAAFGHFTGGIRRGLFCAVSTPWDDALIKAEELSQAYTAAHGSRCLDVLHVALALLPQTEHFITCDERQAALAKSAGLKVTWVR